MLDPTWLTSRYLADFGSVYTPDGREHPVTATTPAYFTQRDSVREAPPLPPESPVAQSVQSQNVALGWPTWLTPDFLEGKHLAARAVVIVLAVALIIIVAFRLTR